MTTATPEHITIRRAQSADGESLLRLAQLDSRRLPPPGTFLIAEVDGEPRAAVTLESDEVIADPFRPSADLVEMLRLRAARIREAEIREAETAATISPLGTAGGPLPRTEP
jgi:hypothetical protein